MIASAGTAAKHPRDWEFFGYGRLEAPLWFIGLEEHCGSGEYGIDAKADARRRLTVLPSFPPVVDVAKACDEYGFPGLPHGVPVWEVARRTAVACGYSDCQPGAAESDVCLLELLPLPTPSTDVWLGEIYGPVFGYHRKPRYIRECAQPRADRLRSLVLTWKPRLVIVHGKEAWRVDVGAPSQRTISIRQKRSWKPVEIRTAGRTILLYTHNFGRSAGWSGEGKGRFVRLAGKLAKLP